MTKLPPPNKSRNHLPGEAQGGRNLRPGVNATAKRAQVAKQKAEILKLYEQGHTASDACRLAGLSKEIWDYYKRSDSEFKLSVELITMRRAGKKTQANTDISFEEFSEKYLNSKRFWHQLQWIDVIEGREPRDLHPSQVFQPGDPDTIIINTPPGHAKSTTITMDYVTFKIVTNPNFRVVVISKTETMAKKFLVGIKRRLTNRAFAQLQIDFGPEQGFEIAAESWTSKMIYFGHGDSDQKDPNVEVLGVGQQIYGARADLIILDDIEDLQNAHQYAAHLDYIMQDVMTRDAPLLVVGTRVAPVDIYSELMNPDHYDGDESDWTYLSQPAILEPADDPNDWITLWPYSDQAHSRNPGKQNDEGLWPKWDGPRLAKLRRKIKPATWALVYMQQSVNEDSTFTIEMIHGCQSDRMRGQKVKGDRLYIVAGLDPAASGFTACVVMAVDRRTGRRYVLDFFNKQVRSAGLRQMIQDFTEKYGVNEWRIEKNAFQAFLTQDREINQFLASRGVRLNEHQTGGVTTKKSTGKWDPEWGISSLESLFRGWEDGQALLDLPAMSQNEAYRQFKEQLVTWYPGHPKTQKTDLVMAFWFAELACREQVKDIGVKKQTHMNNSYLSESDRRDQVVINIDDWVRNQQSERMIG